MLLRLRCAVCVTLQGTSSCAFATSTLDDQKSLAAIRTQAKRPAKHVQQTLHSSKYNSSALPVRLNAFCVHECVSQQVSTAWQQIFTHHFYHQPAVISFNLRQQQWRHILLCCVLW
jgi:uncharacterized protein involved in tolerance to divalent cations